ncbi:MAG: response regulator transcription factor [Planctomycetes bacterium]|nr:response regulator transcription factor [Planctomycetota bacterium]
MSIRILIADDHTLFRSGLKTLLERESDFCVVGEAADGPGAIGEVERIKPDILILDLSMPGLRGSNVAEVVREKYPQTQIVVLTMHEDACYLRQMFRLGAKAFVLKKSSGIDLCQAIRAVHRGEKYVDPCFAGGIIGGDVPNGSPPARAPAADRLSPREQEVCSLLAHGLTNGEIAGRLSISERTVESHRANIMEKLDLKSRAELVRFAIDNDLLTLT